MRQNELADALYAAVGVRVREARRSQKMSQEDLANRVGLTRTSITNVEAGRQKLPLHTLFAIAEALGMEAKELLPSGKREEWARKDQQLLQDPRMGAIEPNEQLWVLRANRPARKARVAAPLTPSVAG